jgi:dihydropteroate synthase
VAFSPRRPFSVPLPGRAPLDLGARTLVMGVLNVTPDSFSDGGQAFDAAAAVDRALEIEAEGADILDIGAESTRPGATPLDHEEEWRRLRPVLKGLTARLTIPVSIDTYRAETARRALDAGVAIVNDISGLEYDPRLGGIVAERRTALVLIHTRGRPQDMYQLARYGDVTAEVSRDLQRRVERAVGCGIGWERLIVDPGLGFAKQAVHSLRLLATLDTLAGLGRPLLVGASRKSFLAAAAGQGRAADRDWATAAAVTASILAGAHIVRVHRIAELVQVVRVADALRAAGGDPPSAAAREGPAPPTNAEPPDRSS